MYVLHAHWHPPTEKNDTAGMLFWTEQSNTPPSPTDRRGRKVVSHPFCDTSLQVQTLLQEITGIGQTGNQREVKLLLPTTKSGPLPSPQLLHDWELETAAPTLVPWKIVGLWVTASQALTLLTRLSAISDLPPHLRLGDDSRFWMTAAGLVLEVIAQQKVLPSLTQVEPNIWQAQWAPILDGPKDGPRLARLSAAMPPLCRAEADDPKNTEHPRRLLEDFLNTTSDAAMQQWAQKAALPLTIHQDATAHDWLRAFFTANRQIKGSAAQIKRLADSHKAWVRNLHMAGDNHFRIAFRLEAPALSIAESLASAKSKKKQAQPEWQLHFLLQARDDPSLLAPAEMVWQTRGNLLKTLDRHFENPQEKLLAGLGYAARLFEPVRRSLQGAKPHAATLTAEEAFAFLRQNAPLFEESGFGVLVPPWWNKPNSQLRLRLKMRGKPSQKGKIATEGGLNFEKLVNYNWELSVGDTTLSREEFDALVALKSPLVQIRGQWVQLDSEQIETAIKFWQKHSRQEELDLLDALSLGLGADKIDGMSIESVEYEGWMKDWMERFTRHEDLAVLTQPATLQGQLRTYQQFGFSWLDFMRRWQMGACLADDMGLGKTIQTLAMLLREKEQNGSLPGPTLLICPTSVVMNWAKEVEKFAPGLSTHIHQGIDRLRGEEFIEQARKTELVLTSYPLMRRDEETFNQIDWFGVILDEAQNIKNAETKQSRTIRQLSAGFRLALTGTPVENRLSELWSIMQFLNPGFLGSQQTFRRNFALPIERNQDADATQRLRNLVSPFILRRVKTDPTVIQDLPEKQETKVYSHLSEEQATLYEAVVLEALQQIESAEDAMKRRGQVLSMLMKLKQICNHPAQFLHQIDEKRKGDDLPSLNGTETRSGKLARLVEMLEEIVAANDRTLIFTQFAEMGQLLRSYLQQRLGVATIFLHGGTRTKQRSEMVERFQNDPNGPQIFILSLKAGGVGINLTRANHVFHFDRWWNPAVENQATDRAFRIGQKRNVQVHKFVCLGTLEEKIDEMIERKKALANSVVGEGENWLTELSTDELRDMVKLRREVLE